MRIGSLVPAALLALAVACGSTVDPLSSATGALVVANASNGWLDVDIDGRRWVTGLSMNATSYVLAVPMGLHQVRLSHGGGVGGAIELPLPLLEDAPQTVVAFPSFPVGSTPDMSAAVLTDTGAYVPGGKSKLRVANLAATAGDAQIWRRQPDFPAGSPIMAPFPYRAVSPYLQSDAGVWEVWLATPNTGAKELSSGPIQIPSGERRTVLVVDTQEGPRFVVLGL
jgi:hypothetical protein